MKNKRKIESKKHCPCLELTSPAAGQVFISGTFNDWSPTATPMIAVGDGKWKKELSLPPGRYEYRFVIDGQWADDPDARDFAPNPHGSRNAILVIAESTQ